MIDRFDVKEITVEDYMNVRDYMINERMLAWSQHESCDFENDYLGELIETYDFVIDTLTCLAMDLDKLNKEIGDFTIQN